MRKDDVARSVEDRAETTLFQKALQGPHEFQRDPLVPGERRGGSVARSIDQLVAPAIVRKEKVIFVDKPDGIGTGERGSPLSR